MYPPAPALSSEEGAWAAAGALSPSPALPTWADVEGPYMGGDPARLPWSCPVWDASGFVPGLPGTKLSFWEHVVLRDHPQKDAFVSFLCDGVVLHDMLLPPFRRPSVDQPFNPDRFRGAVFSNRVPPAFNDFVDKEISSLVELGCVSKWSDVRAPGGPSRPRLIMPGGGRVQAAPHL